MPWKPSEPIVKLEIICPNESIGDLIKLCDSRRGIFRDQKILSEERSILHYEMPLAEIIFDFYDKLKSVTHGYGTMDYELVEYRIDKLSKVQILVNGEEVEALSLICHRDGGIPHSGHLEQAQERDRSTPI